MAQQSHQIPQTVQVLSMPLLLNGCKTWTLLADAERKVRPRRRIQRLAGQRNNWLANIKGWTGRSRQDLLTTLKTAGLVSHCVSHLCPEDQFQRTITTVCQLEPVMGGMNERTFIVLSRKLPVNAFHSFLLCASCFPFKFFFFVTYSVAFSIAF